MKDTETTAKELVEKFRGVYGISWNSAKQCALICVDEMMLSYEAEDGDHATQYYYWQQVRTAINQL